MDVGKSFRHTIHEKYLNYRPGDVSGQGTLAELRGDLKCSFRVKPECMYELANMQLSIRND